MARSGERQSCEHTISCATTFVNERSPANNELDKNVNCGFSIPPYGKAAGNTTISYYPNMRQPKLVATHMYDVASKMYL
jgi:hypothetical protein